MKNVWIAVILSHSIKWRNMTIFMSMCKQAWNQAGVIIDTSLVSTYPWSAIMSLLNWIYIVLISAYWCCLALGPGCSTPCLVAQKMYHLSWWPLWWTFPWNIDEDIKLWLTIWLILILGYLKQRYSNVIVKVWVYLEMLFTSCFSENISDNSLYCTCFSQPHKTIKLMGLIYA